MPTLTIKQLEKDPYTADLTQRTYDSIFPHWRSLLPSIEVQISDVPFDHVPAIENTCRMFEKERGWSTNEWPMRFVICTNLSAQRTILWVYRNSDHPEFYFQQELLALIAIILWETSDRLQQEVLATATGTAATDSQLAFVAFRDSFVKFFLNPFALHERKPDAMDVMWTLNTIVHNWTVE